MFTGFQKKITILSVVSNAYVGDMDCPFYCVCVCVSVFVWELYCIESLCLLAHFRAPALCGGAIEWLCNC